MRTLTHILFALGAGYVGLVALLYALQDRLLYPRTSQLIATPAERDIRFEEMQLQTDDGETLHGWWLPADPERGVLLFCHGNAGNISGRLDSIEQFLRLGLSVLIFDYRGYGESTGTPSEDGLYRDADAAWRHLTETRGHAPSEIVLFGRSLGGGPATWLAEHKKPGALILESAFTSVPDVAADQYPFAPVRPLARSRFNNLERVPRLEVPLLVIHSDEDVIIPIEHGHRLYEAAREPKAFLQIKGRHNDGFLVTGARYREGIDAFLKQHLERYGAALE